MHLFIPLCGDADKSRNEEVKACVDANFSHPFFDTFHILSEDESVVGSFPDITVPLNSRPTFSDWLNASAELPEGDISVLINSDIIVDNTIEKFSDILGPTARKFITASRYDFDYTRRIIRPHPNPKVSQDAWALRIDRKQMTEMARQCPFPLGMQGCENKLAFVFWNAGYDVINPCLFVNFLHYHRGKRVEYNQEDCAFDGGFAKVWPAMTLDATSKVDVWWRGERGWEEPPERQPNDPIQATDARADKLLR
jgi:hypothetical protein